jgi:hypothetical protein
MKQNELKLISSKYVNSTYLLFDFISNTILEFNYNRELVPNNLIKLHRILEFRNIRILFIKLDGVLVFPFC